MTRRMGPNSPAVPAASRKVPNLVDISPASRRIGISVPIAVVAIAEPVNRSDSTIPAAASAPPTPYASANDSSQPSPASISGRPRSRPKSIS